MSYVQVGIAAATKIWEYYQKRQDRAADVNIRDLLEEMVAKVTDTMRDLFREQRLQDLKQSTDHVVTLFSEYKTAYDRERLEAIILDPTITRCKSDDVNEFNLYAVLVVIRAFAMAERRRFGINENTNILSMLYAAKEHCDHILPIAREQTKARFGPLTFQGTHGGGNTGEPLEARYRYTFDGRRKSIIWFEGMPSAEMQYNAIVNRTIERETARIVALRQKIQRGGWGIRVLETKMKSEIKKIRSLH